MKFIFLLLLLSGLSVHAENSMCELLIDPTVEVEDNYQDSVYGRLGILDVLDAKDPDAAAMASFIESERDFIKIKPKRVDPQTFLNTLENNSAGLHIGDQDAQIGDRVYLHFKTHAQKENNAAGVYGFFIGSRVDVDPITNKKITYYAISIDHNNILLVKKNSIDDLQSEVVQKKKNNRDIH